MTSSARLDDLQQKFAADPRRYFAPLANEFRKRGDAARAVELCRTHLPQQPGHLSGHVVLAHALRDLDQRDAAQQAYEDALALDPENVVVLRSLGDLARDRDDVDTARSWYERAMGLDPRDPDIAQRVAGLERPPAQAQPEVTMGFTAALAAANARNEAEAEHPEVTQAPVEDAAPAAAPEEADEQREAADFTAGFFAAVLEESSDVGTVGAGDVQSPSPEPVGPDAAPQPTEREEADDIDRLFDELPPLHLDADPVPDGTTASPPLPPGTELALLDGGAVVPDVPPRDDLAHALDDLTHALDDLSAPLGSSSFAVEDGPLPLVADEEPRTLEDLAPEVDAGEDVVDPSPSPAVAEQRTEEWPAPALDQSFAGAGDDEPAGADEEREAEELPDAPVPDPQPDAAAQSHGDVSSAFVTETMAELYLRQGFRDQALAVYRELAARRPEDARLAERVTALAESTPEADVSGQPPEPPAVSWLRRLAVARPTPAAGIATPAPAPESSDADVQAPAAQAAEPVASFEWGTPQLETEDPASASPTQETEEPAAPQQAPEATATEAEDAGEPWAGTSVEEAPAEAESHVEAMSAAEPVMEEPVAQAAGGPMEAEEFASEDDDPWVFDGELMSGGTGYTPPDPAPVTTTSDAPPASQPEPWASSEGADATDADQQPSRAAADAAALPTIEDVLARPAAEADELAAGALVAATLSLQADPAVDALLGESVAEDPAAIQHLLRATPRSVAALRQGASFSFEQFFRPEEAHATAGEAAPPAPVADSGGRALDDESERDLADFHAWLAGLSDS